MLSCWMNVLLQFSFNIVLPDMSAVSPVVQSLYSPAKFDWPNVVEKEIKSKQDVKLRFIILF